MRYTEVRMAKIAHELLADLDKATVDFVPNYDGNEQIPDVLPTRVPNLLINGSSGIAVGMATNIPPHNLAEVIDASLALLAQPDLAVEQLMAYVPGPDFPTAGIINGRAGILQAYKTGRGRIYVRARTEFETDGSGKQSIIVNELPYQLNKAKLLERIAELVKDKTISGITELRDESDKDGMRMVITLRRGEMPEVVLNNLFIHTQLQTVFGINIVALADGQPKLLNLKQLLEHFLQHRREVVTRRTIYLLGKARERGHLLEGLAIALANIEPIIELIKGSPSSAAAKQQLLAAPWPLGTVKAMLLQDGEPLCRPEELPAEYGIQGDEYHLSPAQAQAILDLRLHRLTGLEHEKLLKDYQELLERIKELALILADPERLLGVIKEELVAIKSQYADARRTEIISSKLDLTEADLITEEAMVVTISHLGYAKIQPLADYRAQRRGGRGKAATRVKDEDYIAHLLVTSSHDTLLCFSNLGKVYWLTVYELPQASRISKGRPLVNLLSLDQDERITTILPISQYDEARYVFMATARGTVKKTPLMNFSRPRSVGLIALDLEPGDTLVGAAITDGAQDVMLFSSAGKAVRFKETDVRSMGRTARGVRGIRLTGEQQVIALIIPQPDSLILTASEKGFGKRTPVADYRLCKRGGQGVIAIQASDRNGQLVGAIQIKSGDEVMLISDLGTLVRTRADEISVSSRNTQGVTLIKLAEQEKLVGIEPIAESDIVNDDEAEVAEDNEGDLAQHSQAGPLDGGE
jgi:DNA gyrase subunit A